MIDQSFVTAILQNAAKPARLDIDGKQYMLIPNDVGGYRVHDLPHPPAKPAPIELSTLGNLVAYISENRDELPLEECAVVVHSNVSVALLGKLNTEFGTRPCYAVAYARRPESDHYDFEAHDDFMLRLLTDFLETPEREELLKLVGGIRSEAVQQSHDDGVTQTVTTRRGAVLVAETPVPRTVKLRQWLTFSDLQQPEREFVLRLKQRDGAPPFLGLFPCDGGRWVHQVIDSIKGRLESDLEDTEVVVLA